MRAQPVVNLAGAAIYRPRTYTEKLADAKDFPRVQGGRGARCLARLH